MRVCVCGCGESYESNNVRRMYAKRECQWRVTDRKRSEEARRRNGFSLGDSRVCANARCADTFIIGAPNQLYCSSACMQRQWRAERKETRHNRCVYCGEQFVVRRATTTWCSSCSDFHRRLQKTGGSSLLFSGDCKACGNAFVGNDPKKLYCGKACATSQKIQDRRMQDKQRRLVVKIKCIECHKEITKRHPKHSVCTDCRPRVQRAHNRGREYGLTAIQVLRMWEQDRCDACGEPIDGSKMQRRDSPAIDHCHSTGQVRGVLHSGCNIALGVVGESPARLRALADYIEERAKLR